MNIKLSILKCLLLMVVVGALIVPSATAMPVWYNLNNYTAGELDTHDVKFQLSASTLPSTGKIKIILPDGFDISEAILVPGSLDNDDGYENGNYTLVRDVSTRTLILVRDGTGDDYSGTYVWFTLDRIKNPNIGVKTIDVRTTTSDDLVLDIGTAQVTITPGPATHLNFTTINSQVAGTAFPITVNALDRFENIDPESTYTATLASGIGTITPNNIDILGGTGTVIVTIVKTGTGNITATKGSLTGASNTFTITPAALGSFVIATIPAQFDELAFTVTAQAKDTQGNNKTDYNAVNNLTLTQGLPGTVTLVSPSPATVQFVNGVYSGQVTLNVTPNPTPATLQTGVKLTITNVTLDISKISNGFSISLPVDLKNSTVVANPAIVIEDGSSISTITVTVKNGINQGVIPSATVVLTSDRSWMDSIVPASNITDSNGQATFSIKSSYPGKANLTATVWGTELEKKAVVTFGYDNLLHLSKDWNLVSVPRQLDNSALSALSTTKVDRIYTYDADKKNWKYALYNKTSGTWNGTLTTIDDGKGYWMFASTVTDVPVVLKSIDPLQLPPTYPLKAGWNMIGYTSMQLKLNTDVWNYFYPDLFYQSDSSIWVSAYDWTGSGFDQASPWGDSFPIVRTKGYWIYLKDDATLVP